MQPQADYLLVWKEAKENEWGGYAQRAGRFLTVYCCRAAGQPMNREPSEPE